MEELQTDSEATFGAHSILADIAGTIREVGIECEVIPNGLMVKNGQDGTLVSLQIGDRESNRNSRSEIIARVVTELTPETKFYPREFLKLNSLSALGAVLHNQDSDNIMIVSKHWFECSSQSKTALPVHIIASAALLNAYSFFGGGGGAEFCGSCSVWPESDFIEAAHVLVAAGLPAVASPMGMRLEIPLPEKIASATDIRATSLLKFETREIHPNLGAGLFYKLDLPLKFSELQLMDLSRVLNALEFESNESPPLIGGWTGVPTQNLLSHVGFWPNNIYRPGIVSRLSGWMIERNTLACEMIWDQILQEISDSPKSTPFDN